MSISLIQPFPYNIINEDDSDIIITNLIKTDIPFVYTVTEINKAKIRKEKCETYYYGNSLDFENEIEDEDKIFDSEECFCSNNGHYIKQSNIYECNPDIDTYIFDEDKDFDYDDDIVYELIKKVSQNTISPLCIYLLKPLLKLIKTYAPSKEVIRDLIISHRENRTREIKSRDIKSITTVNRIDESIFNKLSPEDMKKYSWYGFPMNDVIDEKSNNQVKLKLKLKPSEQSLNNGRENQIVDAYVDNSQYVNYQYYNNPNKLLIENEAKTNYLFQNRELNYTNDPDALNFNNNSYENNKPIVQQINSEDIIISRDINNENNNLLLINDKSENKSYPTFNNSNNYLKYNETFMNSVNKLNEIDNQSCTSSSSSMNVSPKLINNVQNLPDSPKSLSTQNSETKIQHDLAKESKDSQESGNEQNMGTLNSLHHQNLSEWEILDKLSSDILEKNKSVFEDEESIKKFNKEYHLKDDSERIKADDYLFNSKITGNTKQSNKLNNNATYSFDNDEEMNNEMGDNTKNLSNSSSVTEFNENELLDDTPSSKPPVYSLNGNNEAQYINDELKEKLRYSQQINQQYLNEIEEESNKRRDLEDKLTKSVNEVKEYSNVITDMEGLIKDYSSSLNAITTIKSNLFRLEQEANNLKIENMTLKEKHHQEKEELEREKKDLMYLLNQYKFKESSEIDSSSEISIKSSSSTNKRRNSFDDNILNKRREIERMEGNVDNNRKSIILFNEQIEFKENEINHLKDSLFEHNKKINILEEQIEKKDKEILNLQDIIKENNEERQREIQNINKLEIPENAISLDEYESLKQQHDEQKSQLNDYINENKNLQEQQKEQKEQLEEYIKENESLINNINKEKVINNDLKKKNITLNKSVEEIQQKFDNLYKEYKDKQKEYSQSISNYNEEKKSNQRLENKITELTKQFQKTKNDYKVILEKLNQTQEKINAKEKEKENLKLQLTKEKKEKVQSETKWKNVLKELEKEKEAKMNNLKKLENEKKLRLQSVKELENKQNEINNINKENENINSRFNKLEKEYDDIKDQNSILNEKYQSLVENNQKEISEKQEIQQKYDEFVKDYQEKLNNYHQLEEELNQKTQLYKEEKEGYDRTISQLENKLNETEANIHEKESQYNDLKKEYDLEIEKYKQNEKQYDSEIEKYKQNEKQYGSEIEKYKQNEKKLKSVIKVYKKNAENPKPASPANGEFSMIKYEEIQRNMEQSKKDLELSQEEIDLLKNKLKEEQDNNQRIQEDYDQLLEKYNKETANNKDTNRDTANGHSLEVMKSKLKQFIQREQLFQKKIQKLSQQLQLEKKSREQAEQKCKEFEANGATRAIPGNEGVSKIKMEELQRVVEQSKKDQQLLLEEIDLLRSMLNNQ